MTQPDGIRRYLDENGATYTTEAMRKSLLEAGYAEADINAALAEWSAAREAKHASPEDQARFRRWALWFHLGALALMVLVVILLKGAGQGGVILLGAGILAVALLIGWYASSVVGRALLPRTGVVVALVVPLASALILGGTCIGLMNGVIPTPPLSGTVNLEISGPEAFSGSASADCYVYDNETESLYSQPLGEIDGMTVTASLFNPTDALLVSLTIELTNEQPGGFRVYSNKVDTDIQVVASSDGMSGEVSFTNMTADPDSEGEPLSGVVSWTCDGN